MNHQATDGNVSIVILVQPTTTETAVIENLDSPNISKAAIHGKMTKPDSGCLRAKRLIREDIGGGYPRNQWTTPKAEHSGDHRGGEEEENETSWERDVFVGRRGDR